MKNKVLELLSIITRTDSYKFSQWAQYPEGITHLSSYIESRGGESKSVFFGLQAFIKDYLLDPITQEEVEFAKIAVEAHGEPFNYNGWSLLVKEHGGFLPIEIQAVPEGTVMETHNVQVQIVNTDERFAWVVSPLETALLRGVWYPSTVATKSRKMKVLIAKALLRSSDVPLETQLNFKLHDFGARGTSSGETAVLGGMGHLVNFWGTDTFEAVIGVMTYYNTTTVVGFSIPASEHSTITSWGRKNEAKAYEHMIDLYGKPGALFACVSDSYDIWKAIQMWGTLKEKLIASGATLVVRPDSGDPETVPIEVIKKLAEEFGWALNKKGFKVLPSYVRVIQGDGINEDSLPKILENLMSAGFSAENIAFGMGGGLLQAWNRDTLRYAMKASAIRINNGPWVGFSKDPVTDHGKRSKEGRLGLVKEAGLGYVGFRTTTEPYANAIKNELRTIYRNGILMIEDDFATIRARAELTEVEVTTEVERY